MRKRAAKTWPKLEPAVIDGVNAIGVLAVYDLSMIRMKRSDVRDIMTELGLNAKLLDDKGDKSAFIASLKCLEDSGIIVQVQKAFDSITYQTNVTSLRSAMDEAGLPSLEIKASAIVRFYKEKRGPKAGTIESDHPEIIEGLKKLMDAEKGMARTTDIYGVIRDTLKEIGDCVPWRRNGGTDFIPAAFIVTARKLEALVERIGGDNSFTLVPVPAGAMSADGGPSSQAKAVWRAVSLDIKRELDSIEAHKKKAVEAVSNDKGESMVDTVYSRFAETNERAKMYAEFLGMQAQALLDQIASSEADFIQKVGI